MAKDPFLTPVARPAFKLPSYRLHKPSGLAVVTIRGRNIYLGKFGTPESRAEYDRVIREFTVARGVTPDERAALTVAELVLCYWNHAKSYYPPSTLVSCIKPALRRLRQHAGDLLVAEFGPLKLKALRLALLQERDRRSRRLSRRYVNNVIAQIRAFFKWGVGEELVPASVHQSLMAVDALRAGRTDAPDPDPVGPVADEHVEAVLPHLPPMIADMIRIQRLTGMRPGELCAMTTGEIELNGEVWIYRPRRHKTTHHGKSRMIPIGPRAREVLMHYLKTDLAAPIFSPAAAMAERWSVARAERKKKITPSQQKRNARRARNPKRRFLPQFTTSSYGGAVRRACAEAGVPRWSPNQLRHTRATELRRQCGLDVASAVLGHSKLETTQIYAERDLAAAKEAARMTG